MSDDVKQRCPAVTATAAATSTVTLTLTCTLEDAAKVKLFAKLRELGFQVKEEKE